MGRSDEPPFNSGRLPGDPRCPACGTLIDGFTSAALDDATPTPGCPTVCVYCASLLVFGDDLHPRFPSDAELAAVAPLPEVQIARSTALAFIRRRADRA